MAHPIGPNGILEGSDNRFLANHLVKNLRTKLPGNDLIFHMLRPSWSGPGVTVAHQMTRCRCFLPDLAGFTGSNCTAPLSLIRREWDSNPRWSFPHTRFPSVLLQPLGHLSRLQSLPTLSQTSFILFERSEQGEGTDPFLLPEAAGSDRGYRQSAGSPEISSNG